MQQKQSIIQYRFPGISNYFLSTKPCGLSAMISASVKRTPDACISEILPDRKLVQGCGVGSFFTCTVLQRRWLIPLAGGDLGSQFHPEIEEGKIKSRESSGAPRASPWHHFVSPIRFANGGT